MFITLFLKIKEEGGDFISGSGEKERE